jgi:hypothetical protein
MKFHAEEPCPGQENTAPDVRRYAALAGATLLNASGEHLEATKLLGESQISSLPRKETNTYLLALAEQGIDISGLVDSTSKPKLPDHLISPRSFALAEGLITVFDDLRIALLVDPTTKAWFQNEIAARPGDVKLFLSTLGSLADLWLARVTRKQQPTIANQFADTARAFLRVRQQLLNADSPISQFDQELPEFLEYVWEEANKALDDTQLSEFAATWLQHRSESSRKPPSEATRGLTAALAPRLSHRKDDVKCQ